MSVNEKELLVLQAIKNNPFLSQQEMAEQLSMSRPALANIISGLIKKGEIVGRAYVLPEKIQSLPLAVPTLTENSILMAVYNTGRPIRRV